jgi:hypothetical protein
MATGIVDGKIIKLSYWNNRGIKRTDFYIQYNEQRLYVTDAKHCRPIRDNNTGSVIKTIREILGRDAFGSTDTNGFIEYEHSSNFYETWMDVVTHVGQLTKDIEDSSCKGSGTFMDCGIYDKSPNNGLKLILMKEYTADELIREGALDKKIEI